MRRTPKILIAIGLAVGLAPLAVAIVADNPAERSEALSPLGANPSFLEIDRTAELRACRDRGAEALDHPPCLRLWSEQRDRFLSVAEPEKGPDPSSSRPSINPPDVPRPPPGQD